MTDDTPKEKDGRAGRDEPPSGKIRSRNPLRRLYDWVLSWAESPWGAVALFLLAFCESSFFPIPPDVLLIALAIGARKKAFRYAALCTAGSVLGGVAGYALGWAAAPVGKWLIVTVASEGFYYDVAVRYGENAFAAIAIAGFTPIPYKVFTVTAGIFHEQVPLTTLVAGSLLSRTARFFLVAGLIYAFGPPVRRFIDRYFNLVTLVFTVLLVGGIALAVRAGGDTTPVRERALILVQELEHPDTAMRARAVEELRALSEKLGRARDFGFVPSRSGEENAEALRRWRAWAESLPVRDSRGDGPAPP